MLAYLLRCLLAYLRVSFFYSLVVEGFCSLLLPIGLRIWLIALLLWAVRRRKGRKVGLKSRKLI